MKRLILSVAAFILSFGTANRLFAQEIPQLDNGQPYAKQRQKIIANEWVMVTDKNKTCARFGEAYRAACRSYPELDSCGSDDHCSLFWRGKDGTYLEIYAYGKRLEVVGFSHPAIYKGNSKSPEK